VPTEPTDNGEQAAVENVHPCHVCGALVAGGVDAERSSFLHAAWHGLLERRLELIAEEASRYKSPPVYGGGR
jgi:hypothetical protein